jgi:hypothetical protein
MKGVLLRHPATPTAAAAAVTTRAHRVSVYTAVGGAEVKMLKWVTGEYSNLNANKTLCRALKYAP